MKLTAAEFSTIGPVRYHNEDCAAFWQHEGPGGAVVAIADGVGGLSCGEIASRMAVDSAIQIFKEAQPGAKANAVLARIFKTANIDIYDFGMQSEEKRMATTLSVSILSEGEVAVGHVGDCRVYLVRNGEIQRLTKDHTYVQAQLKLGLITEHDAMTSEFRSVLTRTLGQNTAVPVDFSKAVLSNRDFLIQCSDGLHGCLMDHEIGEAVTRMEPTEACHYLVSLAENRGAEDNISIQIIRIDEVAAAAPAPAAGPVLDSLDRAATDELDVNRILDERFEITDVIHRSSMSTVFKATDLQSGQIVAIKAPLMSLESDPGFYSRFEREEQIGKSLDHPGILRIIPVAHKSRPYIVMEFVEGQTLDRVLRNVRPVPVQSALQIASRLCDALAYMHKKGIVHRDLKPQNIMVCNDGTLRIMDFGIAKTQGMKRITFGGFSPTLGTPDYMAPEQIKGQRGDERTDIYSLGAILFEMVTGQVPFQGPNAFAVMNARLIGDPPAPRDLNPEIPEQVEEIILRAMEREPYARYPSAETMKAALDAPESVRITGRSERLRPPAPWKSRFRSIRIIAIATLLPILAFLLFWWLFSRQGR